MQFFVFKASLKKGMPKKIHVNFISLNKKGLRIISGKLVGLKTHRYQDGFI